MDNSVGYWHIPQPLSSSNDGSSLLMYPTNNVYSPGSISLKPNATSNPPAFLHSSPSHSFTTPTDSHVNTPSSTHPSNIVYLPGNVPMPFLDFYHQHHQYISHPNVNSQRYQPVASMTPVTSLASPGKGPQSSTLVQIPKSSPESVAVTHSFSPLSPSTQASP